MSLGPFSSQRFGYAVHSLCYLAKKPFGTVTTLPELAGWLRSIWPQVSETYLGNVIQRMSRGGILRSHRGVSGGYSLARPAEQISMRDVVELLEGVSVDSCSLSLEGECPVRGLCAIQNKLARIEEEYLQSLGRLSIAELANDLRVKLATPKAAKGKGKTRATSKSR